MQLLNNIKKKSLCDPMFLKITKEQYLKNSHKVTSIMNTFFKSGKIINTLLYCFLPSFC